MDNAKEIWMDIQNCNGKYQISNKGNVWTTYQNRKLKPSLQNNGYLYVNLINQYGHRKKELVHRLVALHFIPNPEGKPEVHHIDENKLNISVENLQWVTRIENVNAGTRNARMTDAIKKPVLQFDKQGNLIKEWDSANDVEKELGIDQGSISAVCHKKKGRHTAGDFKWEFTNKK